MRDRVINWVKNNHGVLKVAYLSTRKILNALGAVTPVKKQIIFSSFGGRAFNDSPYALYRGICEDERFDAYELVWAFVSPENHSIPRGKTVKIDTPAFFRELLSSEIWVSNAGIDRGIELSRKKHISVETWHGTPIKKIGDDSNNNTALNENKLRKKDSKTIRCAQSEYDLEIFERVLNADEESFLLCDLPRNDELCASNIDKRSQDIKNNLNIPAEKKVLLYMPTYREYWQDKTGLTEMKQFINVGRWEEELGDEYVLLIRAHYAVNKQIDFQSSPFVRDVSGYSNLNDLFIIADILISDYSSAMIDYSILDKPLLCYAMDYDEYLLKRGTYVDLDSFLPCPVDKNERELIARIRTLDYSGYSQKSREFHMKYAPYAGHATEKVIEEIAKRASLIHKEE